MNEIERGIRERTRDGDLSTIAQKITSMETELHEVHAAVLGNGSPETCIAVRLQTCERRLKGLRVLLYGLAAILLTAVVTPTIAALLRSP